jgi:predicted esterase
MKAIRTQHLGRTLFSVGWLDVALFALTATLIAQAFPKARRLWREFPREGQQVFSSVRIRNQYGFPEEVKFLVSYPDGYFSKRPWPMLLYLHGAGQRGNDLNQLFGWGLPALMAKGKRPPMVVVSPQCRKNRGWDSEMLLQLLDHVERRLAVDRDRIYVCGESMGGNGTWDLSAAAPDRFAAAVPVCGWGQFEDAEQLTKLPIWAFHGGRDDVVPIAKNHDTVEAVREKGGHVRFTVFPELGHSITDEVFCDDLFAWLSRQLRGAAADEQMSHWEPSDIGWARANP